MADMSSTGTTTSRSNCLRTPASTILTGGALRKLDTGLLGQSGESLLEVEAVAAHDEREDVAVLAAPEAMPGLSLRSDREGRSLLGVERAEAL